VDDAARASALLYRLWSATGNDALKRWAEGLMDFVLWMHAGDGLWHNFILDWDGARNAGGPTSAPGINYWQARSACAIAEANLALRADCSAGVLTRALDAADSASPPSDVRALHALSLLAVLERAPDPRLTRRLEAWCDELAACQLGGMLMNSPDERGQPHLWGHVQEAALMEAAQSQHRPELAAIATRSADAVFTTAIESGFDLQHVAPYDVQSAITVMDTLFKRTGHAPYGAAASRARAWFDLRNPSHSPVYMRDEGRVADGVDTGAVSRDSGAEANICAGLALIDDPFVLALAASWPGASPGT